MPNSSATSFHALSLLSMYLYWSSSVSYSTWCCLILLIIIRSILVSLAIAIAAATADAVEDAVVAAVFDGVAIMDNGGCDDEMMVVVSAGKAITWLS